MGRSIALPKDRDITTYMDWEETCDQDSKFLARFVRAKVKKQWPSMVDEDYFIEDEVRVVCENKFAKVTISTLGHLAAVCVVCTDRYWEDEPYGEDRRIAPLARNFVYHMEDKFREMFQTHVLVSTGSNGESMYRRIKEVSVCN